MFTSPNEMMPPAAHDLDVIRDVELTNFMQDVVQASRERLVIVDFWATWCGPCKQLTPVLEKLVRGYNGAVMLAKVDIDRNPQIAQQMGVQSVPAVFAIHQGRPVDGFMGALPESQVKAWIDQILKTVGMPSPAADMESALKQAEAFLVEKNLDAAYSIFDEVLETDATNAVAFAGLIRCLLAKGEVDAAKQMFEGATPDMLKHGAFDAVRAALELAESTAQASSQLDGLKAAVDKDPADHQARFDLAMACYGAGQREEAVDHLLEIVRRNRSWNEDAARKQLVKFFEAFGAMDPLTIAARKRLSSLLFA